MPTVSLSTLRKYAACPASSQLPRAVGTVTPGFLLHLALPYLDRLSPTEAVREALSDGTTASMDVIQLTEKYLTRLIDKLTASQILADTQPGRVMSALVGTRGDTEYLISVPVDLITVDDRGSVELTEVTTSGQFLSVDSVLVDPWTTLAYLCAVREFPSAPTITVSMLNVRTNQQIRIVPDTTDLTVGASEVEALALAYEAALKKVDDEDPFADEADIAARHLDAFPQTPNGNCISCAARQGCNAYAQTLQNPELGGADLTNLDDMASRYKHFLELEKLIGKAKAEVRNGLIDLITQSEPTIKDEKASYALFTSAGKKISYSQPNSRRLDPSVVLQAIQENPALRDVLLRPLSVGMTEIDALLKDPTLPKIVADEIRQAITSVPGSPTLRVS